MAYLSTLLGRAVVDADGDRIGRLVDLVAASRPEMPHPQVQGLVVKQPQGLVCIPFACVAALFTQAIALRKRRDEIDAYHPGPNDLWLARDVLDRQVIDINGSCVVRVNDLGLTRANSHVFVANVDIGVPGLLRRLGLGKLAAKLWARPTKGGAREISWDAINLVPGAQAVSLKVSSDKIKELDPADLAEILSDLSGSGGSDLLDSFDVKTVAGTLEEVEPEVQASLVANMDDDKVADVLAEMAPDEAADLLAELPPGRSRDLLELMEDEEAEDVRKLLTYPEESAGGIMNTEFIAVRSELTAEQVMAVLRKTAHEAETIYYVYVTDADEHLLGVFSLRELVLADPQTRVEEFMQRRVTSVNLKTHEDEVALLVAKYDLLAIPVVDDDNKLHGIITASDALDKLLPTGRKRRLLLR
jgi:magnesium transporter